MSSVNPPPTAHEMTPSVWDCFRSYFYPNSYHSPVDLSDGKMLEHAMGSDEDSEVARNLVNNPDVQKVFERCVRLIPHQLNERNTVMSSAGFQALSQREIRKPRSNATISCSRVFSHPKMPDYIFKSATLREANSERTHSFSNDHNETAQPSTIDSMLRLEMGQTLVKFIVNHGLNLEIPQENILPTQASIKDLREQIKQEKSTKDAHGGVLISRNFENEIDGVRFIILSKKIAVETQKRTEEIFHTLSSEEQTKIALDLIRFVKGTGYAPATFENIRVCKTEQKSSNGTDRKIRLAILDLQPYGLLVPKGSPNHKQPASLLVNARVGLYNLKLSAQKAHLTTISKLAEEHYQKALSQFSVIRIGLFALSILTPLALLLTTFTGPIPAMIAYNGIRLWIARFSLLCLSGLPPGVLTYLSYDSQGC
jgi:hypothetical protein